MPTSDIANRIRAAIVLDPNAAAVVYVDGSSVLRLDTADLAGIAASIETAARFDKFAAAVVPKTALPGRTLAERITALMPRIEGSVRSFEARNWVPNGTLSALATGKRKSPSPKTLKAIATAFGVTVSDLLGDEKAEG